MWLPKDERRLIEGYFALIERPGVRRSFQIHSVAVVLMSRYPSRIAARLPQGEEMRQNNKTREESLNSVSRDISEYIDHSSRIRHAHSLLVARGFLMLEENPQEPDVAHVTLTVAGYDQGRKYAHWLSRSGEWFDEYRNHWLFLIVGFLGGVLGALLVNALKKLLPSQ